MQDQYVPLSKAAARLGISDRELILVAIQDKIRLSKYLPQSMDESFRYLDEEGAEQRIKEWDQFISGIDNPISSFIGDDEEEVEVCLAETLDDPEWELIEGFVDLVPSTLSPLMVKDECRVIVIYHPAQTDKSTFIRPHIVLKLNDIWIHSDALKVLMDCKELSHDNETLAVEATTDTATEEAGAERLVKKDESAVDSSYVEVAQKDKKEIQHSRGGKSTSKKWQPVREKVIKLAEVFIAEDQDKTLRITNLSAIILKNIKNDDSMKEHKKLFPRVSTVIDWLKESYPGELPSYLSMPGARKKRIN